MKKLLLVALILSVCLCHIPVAADDVCMDIQSLDFVAIPDQVTPGSDIVHRLTIDGSMNYHYSCDLTFDPFYIESGMNAFDCGGCDIFSRGNNEFRLDFLYPSSYDINGKVSPDTPPHTIMPSSASCIAFPEPQIWEFGCREVTIYPVYAHFSIKEIPIPSPEFPSMDLPVMLMIGFLGAVLLIRRTREH